MEQKQKILIVGAGGGREHALGWKIAQSPRAGELFFARGNAGTALLGTNLDIKETDISKLLEFAKKPARHASQGDAGGEKIDLVLVVSDDPLSLGAVDEFKKAGFRVWGPTKAAAQIEWSKAFSKDFMRRNNLPTAKFEIFNDFKKAKEYVARQPLPIVIKADGLAFGKGVVIGKTPDEANEALLNIMVKKVFGNSGKEVVIEEFLSGPEISIHALSDGENFKIFPTSQDHKRIGEGDTGPNTGGMGVVGPLPFVNAEIMSRIEKEIIAPAFEAMKIEGTPFEGILYPSVMLTKDGPKIIEFNARFGDPEAQVYMRLLDTDLLEIINSCIDKNLDKQDIKWKNLFACNVALASGGYPGNYEKGKEIFGLPPLLVEEEVEGGDSKKNHLAFGTPPQKGGEGDTVIFHAGTAIKDGKLVTNGGRVLGVSATGDSLQETLDKAYKAIEKISFEGMQYRKDIGKKAILLSK